MPLKRIVMLLLICCCVSGLSAQTWLGTVEVDIGYLQKGVEVAENTGLLIDSNHQFTPQTVLQQHFNPLSDFNRRKRLPPDFIAYGFYLTTTLRNNSDSGRTYYYYPGYYFDSIALYQVRDDVPVALTEKDSHSGYREFTLAARESAHFLVYLKPSRVEFNNIIPAVISEDFINSYKLIIVGNNFTLKNFSYVLSGTLLMMILFMLTNFVINGKKEFLYNSLYSLCMFLLIFLNSYTLKNTSDFTNLYLSYLDFLLLVLGNLFYMRFSRTFLDTRNNYKRLDTVLKQGERFVALLMLVYTYLNFFTTAFATQLMLENVMKFIMLALGVMFIILAAKERNKLMNYIAAGNAALVLFSAISLGIIWFKIKPTSLYIHSLFYYYIGIVLELIFFLLGLNYKNKQELISGIKEQEALKLEAEKKEFETQLAIIQAQQEERNRISADMHDDLGAGMTTIRLYSELAKHKLGEQPIPEIEKISSSANELLTKMNAIIWSMSSSNDSLGNMTAYIRAYALEYFENSGINCKIEIPNDLPNIEVAGKIRRNVFLVVKEALNNALKHAKATEVSIRLVREGDALSLYIQDNGVGINFNELRQFSNGLKNMRKRMEDVDIEFHIENNNGTLITLRRQVVGFTSSSR